MSQQVESPRPDDATALRESEERYRLIVDGARDYAIITTDVDGVITTWSPGAEAVYGWPAREIVGRPIDETFVPEDRARDIPGEERREARAHGVAPDVRWHQRSDGARVFIDGVTRLLQDAEGRPRGYIKIGQDVTSRRLMEQALLDSEARYRALVTHVRDHAIYLLDAEGRISEWTAGAARVTGYAAEEVLGRSIAMLFTPEDRAAGAPQEELGEAAAQGHAEREGWRMRRDGTRFWANEIMTAVRDAGGTLTGFTKVTRDLTERRIAEQAAERARRDAERAALRRELAAAEEEERRRLSRELHDQLGQQLTAFSLGIAASLRLASEHADAQPMLLQRLAQLEEHARAMTVSMRDLALELRPPELDDIGIASAVETYVSDWSARSGVVADVATTGLGDGPLADETATALYRIVQESLTNVARHAGAAHVSVIVERTADQVLLVVEDDGRGFDVGATFERARRERRLGLAGMRERTELAGGTMSIESRPGSGTTLYVRLPIDG